MTARLALIHGGGTGEELIGAVLTCIRALEEVHGLTFEVERFDDARWEGQMDEEVFHPKLHLRLLDFYEGVRQSGGAIVRGSLPAPVLYRLRRDIDQAAKVVPLNPFPLVSRRPDFRVTLLREGVHGVYHHRSMVRNDGTVTVTAEWNEATIRYVAAKAFEIAAGHHPRSVALVLKTSVLGTLGELWLDVFREVSAHHSEIVYFSRPSGAGFSDMWLEPERYGVVVTDDQGGDILSDLVPTVLYDSRNLVPAGNFSPHGHASYQTDHGTLKPIKGRDEVNPVAMIGALAMALRHTCGQPAAAAALEQAVADAFGQGCRTRDLPAGPGTVVLGTRAMTERICANLRERALVPA